MTDIDDYVSAIVIDNGTLETRVGFAGEDKPKSIFGTAVGRQYPTLKVCCVGNEALRERGEAERKGSRITVKYPIEFAIITNWDDMEALWHYTFYSELRVAPEEHPVLLTDAAHNPKANKEKMTQIMFEKFNTPAMFAANQAVLSLYASGRTTGMVVESGEGATRTVPCYGGHALSYATKLFQNSGQDLTYHMLGLLMEKGHKLPEQQYDMIKDIKEKLCYVALDYETEMSTAGSSPSLEKTYQLPDGRTFTIGDERFRCPEILFQHERNLDGIQEAIYRSIMKCNSELHKDLYANIVLSGGTTLIHGFADRIKKEVKAFAPSTMEVKVIEPAERKLTTWIGGSILASLGTFAQMWISKDEYDEFGPGIVHRKCY